MFCGYVANAFCLLFFLQFDYKYKSAQDVDVYGREKRLYFSFFFFLMLQHLFTVPSPPPLVSWEGTVGAWPSWKNIRRWGRRDHPYSRSWLLLALQSQMIVRINSIFLLNTDTKLWIPTRSFSLTTDASIPCDAVAISFRTKYHRSTFHMESVLWDKILLPTSWLETNSEEAQHNHINNTPLFAKELTQEIRPLKEITCWYQYYSRTVVWYSSIIVLVLLIILLGSTW